MSYIYVITNDINGKQYVGKTNWTIEKRFKEHIKDSKRERCEKRPLYSAINKYGIEHFSVEQLEECDESIVNEREQYWIQQLNTYGSSGYNATLGGDSKHYYNYQEIASKYLELKNQKETAKYFQCDPETVRTACIQCGVQILSAGQVSKEKTSYCIAQINKQTQQIIQIYPSIMEASRITNINHGSISKACRGLTKSAGGYIWKRL